MKKILSLGVASAVLALTAVAASAESTTTKGVKAELASGEIATGATVIYNIVATGEGVENAQVYLEAEGLEFVKATGANGALAQPNDEGTFLAIAATSAVADGTTIATVEYKVTAAKGDTVKFALKADPDFADVAVDTTVVTDTAAGEATSGDSTPSDNSDSSDNSGSDVPNPDSGIALAIVPAVIAGAAVVVAAKKRK